MLTQAEILEYLETHGGIYRGAIALLKSGLISNFYANARILLERDPETDEYIHHEFLMKIGKMISDHARRLGAERLVGIVTVGETLVDFAHMATKIPVCKVNPHDKYPMVDVSILSEKVLVVDDTTTTGGSIADVVEICEKKGLATVVGALTLIRRDPDRVGKTQVGLKRPEQEFVSLLDIGFDIITEKPDENSVLLQSRLPVRLDVGYAAQEDWPRKYPSYRYIGEPKFKEGK